MFLGHFTFTLFYLHYTEAIMLNLDLEFEAVLFSFVMNSWFHLILHCKEQDQSHLLTILPENLKYLEIIAYISWINRKNNSYQSETEINQNKILLYDDFDN